ncbi:hypothetical protein EDD18DRAFT_1277916 [Armillaria luteobubalina]|uniref:Uncharacterized protein n=1 Tax=Armillaria luteobubalina TaxID=153913 RepID=A0AA39UXL0_9AGAR|nr:hypothetical protein EDD18DRAFT_1277916 [Armillaria luteobubalina]
MDARSNFKHLRSTSDIDTNDAPPPKRTSLVLLKQVLSDKDLEVIVAHVHSTFEFFLPSIDKLINNPSDAAGLKALAIVLGDMVASAARFPHSDVQSEYKDWVECTKLIESNMEVFDATMAAVEAIRQDKPATDEAIRNLFRLQALRLPRITSNEGSGQGAVHSMLVVAAKKSWTSPYIGDCPARLLADINSHVMAAYAQGHGSIGAMIQSSGTGKSRTMHEIAAMVFTIPINIRSTSSADIGAPYPEPDTSVREYLIPNGNVELRKRYHCFLRATFDLVKEEFSHLHLEEETSSGKAFHWREYLSSGDVRETLYSRIVERAITYEGDADPQTEPLFAVNQSFRDLSNAVELRGGANPPSAVKPQDGLKILIYFDEAHTLAVGTPGPTNYDALCSALADIEGFNHFVIFMSTTGALRILGRPQHEYRSSRAVAPKTTLPAPFTILPFDIGPRVLHKQATFETLRSIKHLAAFGRPLWHTMLAAGASPTSLITLARSKLTHNNEGLETGFDVHGALTPGKSVEELKEIVETALVGIRVMIEFAPRREKARRLQEEMVTGHMRIAFSIPSHREYMRSGHPSEPILAETAACTICEKKLDMVKVISDLLLNDLINKGERGELVARLLLTLAWDQAIQALIEAEQSSHGVFHAGGHAAYSRPIPLIQFLTALLPSGYLELVLQSTPDNRFGGNTFAEAFEHAYVHFTHFGRSGSSDAINSASSLAAFIRGMAFQCCSGHPVIDVLIPVLIVPKDVATQPKFNVDELTLDKFHRSCMMISVKDKENAERDNYTINAESLKFWVDRDRDVDVPYITILMQLGIIRKPRTHTAKGPTPTSRAPPTTPTRSHRVPEPTKTPSKITVKDGPTKVTRQSDSSKQGHPRYSIIISGCSSHVYKVITPEQKAMYSAMLASKGMLHEHPYNDEGSLVLLRKMKPFWNLGPACFHWVDVPDVGIVPDIVETEPFVPGITCGNQTVIIGDTSDVLEDNNEADIWHDM